MQYEASGACAIDNDALVGEARLGDADGGHDYYEYDRASALAGGDRGASVNICNCGDLAKEDVRHFWGPRVFHGTVRVRVEWPARVVYLPRACIHTLC